MSDYSDANRAAFLRAEAAYLEPPDYDESRDDEIFAAWCKLANPAEIAAAMCLTLKSDFDLPPGALWDADLRDFLTSLLISTSPEALAEMAVNAGIIPSYDDYRDEVERAEDDGPDPDLARDLRDDR